MNSAQTSMRILTLLLLCSKKLKVELPECSLIEDETIAWAMFQGIVIAKNAAGSRKVLSEHHRIEMWPVMVRLFHDSNCGSC